MALSLSAGLTRLSMSSRYDLYRNEDLIYVIAVVQNIISLVAFCTCKSDQKLV